MNLTKVKSRRFNPSRIFCSPPPATLFIVALHLFLCQRLVRCSLQQRELLEHLFEHYKKELRPVLDERTVTNVAVQLYFKQIQKVKENDQIITVYCWLEEYWRDEFLRWDPSKFGEIRQLHIPVDMIWRPDLLVYNNANMNVRESEMMTNALVQHDGRVSLFRAIITDITCHLNLVWVNHRQMICHLMLASWSYDGSQVMLRPAEEDPGLWMGLNRSNINRSSVERKSNNVPDSSARQNSKAPSFMQTTPLTYYIPNMEWDLIDFRTRSNLKWYDCCPNPYPDICYYFSIKRNPSYYLFTLIMPSALITTITVVGFFTPHSTTGENTEKVSLGVTSLLSLALILMMVSDKLPATSNTVPVLGQYYIGLICIQFTATYVTTWTLGLQMQGNSGRTIPRRLRRWLMRVNARGNFLVRHLLGRELRCTQQSIRQRMRKFDQLLDKADDRPSFLYRPTSTNAALVVNPRTATAFHQPNQFQWTDSNMTKQCQPMNGQPNKVPMCGCGSTTAWNNDGTRGGDRKEHIYRGDQLEREHFCDLFSSRHSAAAAFCGAFNTPTKADDAIPDIVATVRAIRLSLMAQEHQRSIRAEWRLLSRMIEKVLKLAFSVFTVTFAVYMLYDEQATPLISDEWLLAHNKS
uniref:Uncharacterized protein n=1 Tax=Globodera rostochiensis TaxID=31243 RepID=A0A914GTQ4_GLORO